MILVLARASFDQSIENIEAVAHQKEGQNQSDEILLVCRREVYDVSIDGRQSS